jgi:hypothetical protein
MNPGTEPEADAIDSEVEKGGKWGVGGRLAVGFREKVVVLNYTLLHKGPGGNSPQKYRDAERTGAWNQNGKWREPQRRGTEVGEGGQNVNRK